VRATIELARRVKAAQPRLWDFCLKLRAKAAVQAELGVGRPVLHISGRYPTERGCMAIVWPFATHPRHRNEVIVWDLAHDPAELMTLDTDTIRQRLFTRSQDLPEGVTRLPIKTLHLNRAPIVVHRLDILSAAMAERWGVDKDTALRHAETAARISGEMAGVWERVYAAPAPAAEPTDVDEDLYGGFIDDADRTQLVRLRALSPTELAQARPRFRDGRLDELLFRYRARNFEATLDADERARWRAHCQARLIDGADGGPSLAAWMARLDELGEAAAERDDERALEILGALSDWAGEVAP
jgi:exodeoxyribonuclease-1